MSNFERLLDALAGSLSGEPVRGISQADRDAVQRVLALDPSWAEVAALTGKFRRIVRQKRGSRAVKVQTQAPDQVRRIVQGNSLPNMLPSQYALLATNETGKLFARRYAERQLLQIERGATETKFVDPLVIVLDVSDSMWSGLLGSKTESIVWARAVALTMLNLGRKENRPLYVLPFGGNATCHMLSAKSTVRDVLFALTDTRINGGTTWYSKPLWLLLQHMDTDQWDHADLVWITDGAPHDVIQLMQLSPTWLQAVQAKKMSTYGMYLPNSYYGNPAPPSALWHVCRECRTVADLEDEHLLKQIASF